MARTLEQLVVEVDADTEGAETGLSNLQSTSTQAFSKVEADSSSLDRVGERADIAEQRAMGFRDTLTGLQDTMAGTGEIARGNLAEGLFTLGAGVGDLASGVANLAIPLVKTGKTFIVTTARMVAAQAAATASIVRGWVVMGARALANGARMAAAWVIAMGPIAIVIAAIIGLVALIIANWDTVKRVTVSVFSSIVGFVGDVAGSIKDAFWDAVSFVAGIWDVIVFGLKSNLNGVIGLINGAIGGINSMISTANRIPGVNIPFVPYIPFLAEGGIVTGPTLAMIGEQGPEAVIPLPNAMRGTGTTGEPERVIVDFRNANEDAFVTFLRSLFREREIDTGRTG